jgi:hypothetical protein
MVRAALRGFIATSALALALLVPAATATGSAGRVQFRPGGIVPHLSAGRADAYPPSKAVGYAPPTTLTFDAGYETLINQYFADVASDSTGTANVYSVATQYYDNPGTVHVQYQSTVGGSYVSRDPLPRNGCNDGFDTYCLTDQQLQQEIQAVLTSQGWHGGLDHIFFLMTPNGVGSCGDSTSTECSTNKFCAYHSYFIDSGNEDVIYANEPYEGPYPGCTDPAQGFPNDVDSDTTINTISHEHNEAITDPLTDPTSYAWITANLKYENGDLCAYGFGTPIGGTPGLDAYNQVINTHNYELQEEWSNADNGCVQRPGGSVSPATSGSGPLAYHGGPVMHTNTTYAIYWLPTSGNTGAPAITGTAAVNQVLTSSPGSWNGAPTSFSYQWQRCLPGGTSCANIPGATGSTYTLTSADGGNVVRSTVSATNVNGASAYAASAISSAVIPLPAATAPPVISGVAAAGKSLSVSTGTWNTPATFTYQWLSCNAKGTGCAAVAGATDNSYFLLGEDAGHTLQVVVTATNAAGTGQTLSKRSALIVGVPHLKRAPRISGRARVAGRLTVSKGTWSGPPRSYRYQWLRCNARGGGCRSIRRATHPTYRASSTDVGHRLRVRVTAANPAGRKTATSGASRRIAP